MGKAWLRKLIHQVLHGTQPGRLTGKAARKQQTRYRLCLEHLETRTLPSTVQPVTAANLQIPTSDSAGGTSQVMTSADGRFTVYASTAPNLVAGQINTAVDANIYLYDQQMGTTTLVSHAAGLATTGANGNSEIPRISGDGSLVAYESTATNLVAGQNGPVGQFNVFLYNTGTGTTTLVSHRVGSATTTGDDLSLTTYTTGFGFNSNTGQFLLFNSAANDLIAGETGPTHENVFLYNTSMGTTTLVSHNTSSALTRGNNDSEYADLTPDGSSIVFQSFAGDLVPGQTGPENNIFLYNSGSGSVQLISGVFTGFGNSSSQAAGSSEFPFISDDGSVITYLSSATNLVAGQTTSNGSTQSVFYYNTALSTTTLVSGANGSSSVTANAASQVAALSSDGSTIAFTSDATNLIPGQGNTTGNVFVYSTSSGSLTLASHAPSSITTAAGGVYNYPSFTFADLSLSSDGRFLAYISTSKLAASQSGPSGTKNVYVYDALSGQNTLVSQVNGSPNTPGDYDSNYSRISDDGSTIAFLSLANNLDPAFNIADGGQNLFLFDVPSGPGPTLASRSAFQASATSLVYGSSGNGEFVLFSSNATNVVPHQTDYNFDQDLFLYDRTTGTTTLVSHIAGGGNSTTTGNFGSPATVGYVDLLATPVISNDGNFVAFVSQANNLVAGESAPIQNDQVYLFDRLTDTVTLISHNASSSTTTGDDASDSPAISADGTYVVFRSLADNLVPGGIILPAGVHLPNIYLYDTVTGTMTLVSYSSGNPSQSGDAGSAYPVISDDGNTIAYPSRATDLVANATVYPTENDFVYDRLTGTNALVSHVFNNTLLSPNPTTAPGTPPTVASTNPVISADGSTIAYASFATNLVAGQSGTVDTTDVFLYNVQNQTNQLASGTGGSASATANNYSDSPVLNSNGTEVAFRSSATNLVASQSNAAGSTSNIFLFNVSAGTMTLASHASGSATTTAAGNSTSPEIDGLGGLIVYLSTATNLVPSQSNPLGVGVNNAFLYVPGTSGNVLGGANILVSGQNGSPSLASATPIYLAILSRDPVAFFNLLSGAGAASAAFSNTLVQLVLSNNTVADGSPPQTLVGTLSVSGSFFAGAFLPPALSMSSGDANNASFILGSSAGGQANLATDFTANVYVQPSYQISVAVDFGIADLNDIVGTLPVVVGPGPAASPASVVGRAAQDGQWWDGVSNGVNGFTNVLAAVWDPSVTWADVQTGDFNGDGFTDLVGMDLQSGQWWVGLSDGAGHFTTSLWDTWNPNVSWVDVQVGDLNGDGKADLIGRYLQTGQWWAAISTGSSFVNFLWTTWAPSVTWVDVHVGDVTGDGKADLMGRYLQTGQWWVALFNGSTVTNALWTTWSPSVTWVDVQIGDLNGDGKADLIGMYQQTGQWWAAISSGNGFTNVRWDTWAPDSPGTLDWVDVHLADFNGDGKADLIGRIAENGQWWVGLSGANGMSNTLWATWSPAVSWTNVQIGDFNGDGKMDLAGQDPQSGQWWVGLSTGTVFSTSLWDTWSPAVTWVDVHPGVFGVSSLSETAAPARHIPS